MKEVSKCNVPRTEEMQHITENMIICRLILKQTQEQPKYFSYSFLLPCPSLTRTNRINRFTATTRSELELVGGSDPITEAWVRKRSVYIS